MQGLLALAIAVVLVLAGVYVPVSPVAQERDEFDKAVRQRAQLNQEVTQLQVYRQRYGELKSQMDALSKQLETLKTIVPEEKEVDEFIRLVQGAAVASNVQVRRLTAQPIVAKEYHYDMPFEVQADGPYFNVLDFFGRLSRLSRIINVGDLNFEDARSDQGRPSIRFARAPRCPEYLRPRLSSPSRLTRCLQIPRRARTGGAKPQQPGHRDRERDERTMRSVNTLVVGILLATGASCAQAQGTPAAGGAKPAAPAAKSGQRIRPRQRRKPKPSPQPAHRRQRRDAAAAAAATPRRRANPAAANAAGTEVKLSRRDPFESLVNRQKDAGAGKNLPPGKAGLQVSTLRLDGIVRSSNGMIAVVSNPQARTYFLREGDQLYDGRVEKIAMDGVSFHEIGKDAFGKPVERQVNKRIYASAGEQQ